MQRLRMTLPPRSITPSKIATLIALDAMPMLTPARSASY
jgi:hypothetical protein